MIVVDASVVVDYLLGNSGPAGDELATAFADHVVVIAPHLVDVEVTQVLRRYALRGDLAHEAASVLVRELTELPITRYGHVALVERAFQLRDNVTAYDAAYLALAELADVALLTADGGLADVPGSSAAVQMRATA